MTNPNRFLDPRFAMVVAFMDEARTDIERQTRRKFAEEIATACGFTFDDAMSTVRISDPAHLSTATPPIAIRGLSVQRAAEIVEALAADPSRSDRDVARALGCSPTLVGRARAAAGLARGVREVRRGGQCYAMQSKTISCQKPSPGHLGESPAADM